MNIENVFPDTDDEFLANVPETKITQVEINSEGGSIVKGPYIKDGSKNSLGLPTAVPSQHSLNESSNNPIGAGKEEIDPGDTGSPIDPGGGEVKVGEVSASPSMGKRGQKSDAAIFSDPPSAEDWLESVGAAGSKGEVTMDNLNPSQLAAGTSMVMDSTLDRDFGPGATEEFEGMHKKSTHDLSFRSSDNESNLLRSSTPSRDNKRSRGEGGTNFGDISEIAPSDESNLEKVSESTIESKKPKLGKCGPDIVEHPLEDISEISAESMVQENATVTVSSAEK